MKISINFVFSKDRHHQNDHHLKNDHHLIIGIDVYRDTAIQRFLHVVEI